MLVMSSGLNREWAMVMIVMVKMVRPCTNNV
jgi:hypothetical protein